MNLPEIAMAAAITVSVAGLSYVAFNPGEATKSADSTAAAATCRAVDEAIVAYAGATGAQPRSIADLRPYVRGDVSAYRIVKGAAAGPGC